MDQWIGPTYKAADAHISEKNVKEKNGRDIKSAMTGSDRELFKLGKEIAALVSSLTGVDWAPQDFRLVLTNFW
ncbi:hypothetical protein GCM10009119_23690 [Algoriphagus jejuensis]|uniref:Uncharacterized protein n=1 Tax=Algoriphagus jejuensis TaxID=419934 RepID=A0ABP3YDB0_9BACT